MQTEAFNAEERGERKYQQVQASQLKAFIDRVERLESEKAGISGDIKEIYAEAKGNGFDTKAMRRIIALRKKDPDERRAEEEMIELYMREIGMV